jgi:hypothetical protein
MLVLVMLVQRVLLVMVEVRMCCRCPVMVQTQILLRLGDVVETASRRFH